MGWLFVLYVIWKVFVIALRLCLAIGRVFWLMEVMGETMSDPVFDILLDPLDWLLFTSTNYILCRPIVAMCVCYFALWVCVVIGEVIIDEIFAIIHKFEAPKFPTGGLVDDYWRLTSILRTSNNGYGFPQFYQVVMRDASWIDDPFQPQHVSIVHVVEIRRRNMFWDTVIIWRVSLLDGGQKKVHQFDHFCRIADGKPFSRTFTSRVPSSWQSDGVILIEFDDRLYVWDTRLDVSKSYDLLHLISGMQCLDRIRNANGELEGWKIRNFRCTFEVGFVEGGAADDPENVKFGCYMQPEKFKWKRIHTTEMFGMMVENIDAGQTRTMLCDKSGKFKFCESFDRNCARYFYTPSPTGINKLGPIVINNQECVVCTQTGEIFRTEFNPSSMKYATAEAAFRSMPNLRQRMNADQFQELTGIGEMEKHFW